MIYEAFSFIGSAGYSIEEVLDIRADGSVLVVATRPCSSQEFVLETDLKHITINNHT